MSEFEAAIEIVLDHEKGYVDHPDDPGGATNMGISTRFLRLIGKADIDLKNLTPAEAKQLYRSYWWDEYRYGEVEDQRIANEVMDMAVVAGPRVSHLCLQRALRSASVVLDDPELRVLEDGILGPRTRGAVNNACRFPGGRNCLLAALKSEHAGYFRDLDKPTFERGWLRRAYSD